MTESDFAARCAELATNLQAVRGRIEDACARVERDPASVELLAVSKTRPASDVRAALAAGATGFGENRVQEIGPKASELDGSGARFHFIGSLQTNKVRQLLQGAKLDLLHTVDRPRLVERLAEVVAEQSGREPLRVLLQVHATGEEQKHGVLPDAALELAREVARHAAQLELAGVMAMGPRDGDPAPVFRRVAALHEAMRDDLGLALPVRSFGMTGDLDAAVAAGSTLVRVGTGVFGPRLPR